MKECYWVWQLERGGLVGQTKDRDVWKRPGPGAKRRLESMATVPSNVLGVKSVHLVEEIPVVVAGPGCRMCDFTGVREIMDSCCLDIPGLADEFGTGEYRPCEYCTEQEIPF
jgi:hypothetical protein